MILDVASHVLKHAGAPKTGRYMHQMVEKYSSDLGELAKMDLGSFYDSVRAVPYVDDPDLFGDSELLDGNIREVVGRPKYLLDSGTFPGLDCKKKSILMASWAKENGIPYRFIAQSTSPDGEVHHVFPQIQTGEGWLNVDPTYQEYEIGMAIPDTTNAVELLP